MPPPWELALYSSLLVAGALAGGSLPLLTSRVGGLSSLMALSAGVMVGTVFFVLMPESAESVGPWSWAVVPFGFLALAALEWLFAHRAAPGTAPHAAHRNSPGLGVMGASALFGFSVHTVLDGVALAGGVEAGVGGTVFLAILAHKVPSSVSLSALICAERRPPRTVLLAILTYGLMVPVGALLYTGLNAVIRVERPAAWAMAFSAGTFLFIAGVELLPGALREGGARRAFNLAALAVGVALMGAVALLGRGIHA